MTEFSALYRPDRSRPLTPPASTESGCATCGVTCDGEQDWPVRSGLQTRLFRRCAECVALAGELASITDPNAQAVRLAAELLGHPIAPVDRAAAADVVRDRFVPWSRTARSESAAGAASRFQHLEALEGLIVSRAARIALEADGVPHPLGPYGCAYCGCLTTPLGGRAWTVRSLAPGKRQHVCGECVTDLEEISNGGDELVSARDRLAASADGLGRVPRVPTAPGMHLSYADDRGWSAFHETPGAEPARERWAYRRALTGAVTR